MTKRPSPALLTEHDVAKRLQVSRRTLQRWRAAQTGPAYRRIGTRMIRYAEADVSRWEKLPA